jgi:hypothetical protein
LLCCTTSLDVVECDPRSLGMAHETAGIHHTGRRRGGVAARGARAAARPDTAYRSAYERGRGRPEGQLRVTAFVQGQGQLGWIEGRNMRIDHSALRYLSPLDYEQRRAVDPDPHQPASVLATVKDKPFGRPEAVLDDGCARRLVTSAGRDGRMAPPGAEQKNAVRQEDEMTSYCGA